MSNVDRGSNQDLHDNAPDRSRIVLLLVDVINDLDFPRNEKLVGESVKLGERIAELKLVDAGGIPAIYVNDNYGRWATRIFPRCFAIQFDPMHRGGRWWSSSCQNRVYSDPADTLNSSVWPALTEVGLRPSGAEAVILTGITTNACVMITAGGESRSATRRRGEPLRRA